MYGISFSYLQSVLTYIRDIKKTPPPKRSLAKRREYQKHVEFICDIRLKGSKKCQYLVKRKGESHKTWIEADHVPKTEALKFGMEYKRQVHIHFKTYQIDQKASTSEMAEKFRRCPKFEFLSPYVVLKVAQSKQLKSQEKILNTCKGPALTLENEVDLEEFPMTYTHIGRMKLSIGFVTHHRTKLPLPTLRQCPCQQPNDFSYLEQRDPVTYIKWECNSSSGCSNDCKNRLVQNGPKHPLCIFRTSNGRGWGVKAKSKLKYGDYISEYIGEAISPKEADERAIDDAYCKDGEYGYLMDIGTSVFTVDATYYGNESRFFNHSCEPNMVLYDVVTGGSNARIRAAFFAVRDIEEDEELTFDYNPIYKKSDKKKMRCNCGAKGCRKAIA